MSNARWFAMVAALVLLAGCGDDGGKDKTDTLVSDTAQDTAQDTTGTPDTLDTGADTTSDGLSGCAAQPTLCPDAAPLCDTRTGECVECLTASDCGFFAPLCESGTCVGCTSSTQCAASDFGDLCDVDAGACVECLSNADCTAPTGVCYSLYGVCAACESSFDCPTAGAPACFEDPDAGTIGCAAHATCTGDDARDTAGDDGPAAATVLTFTGGTATIGDAAICNQPAGEESDWYAFDVVDGDSATVTVDWDEASMDLDVSVYDENGELFGESWYVKPEVVTLTYLPAGRVYVVVTRFDAEDVATATPYRLTVTVASSTGCTGAADCAAEYATQLFRGSCASSGACVAVDGGGALSGGANCDSSDDCASGVCGYGRAALASDVIQVTAWYWAVYMAGADTRGVCTDLCSDDAGCSGQVCTTSFGDEGNYCTPSCASDADCPVDLMAIPDAGTWAHLKCTAGHCEAP